MNIKNIKQLVKMIIKTKNTNLFIHGRGGIGKTHNVLSTIKEEGLEHNKDYTLIKGYITPLKFYQTLYDNNDKKLIVIDDVEGLFNNKISKSLLKACLESINGIKIIQYSSTSMDPNLYPNEFNFHPNVIVCANGIPHDLDFKAVLDRCFTYNLKVSNKQLLHNIKSILKKDYKTTTLKDRRSIYYCLNKRVKTYHTNFSYRFYFKCLDAYLFDPLLWKTLMFENLHTDEIHKIVMKLNVKGGSLKSQHKTFYKHTGKSYRTFLRVRKILGFKKYLKF